MTAMKNSKDSIISRHVVPTKDFDGHQVTRNLDVMKLSKEDVDTLKKTDPFMYYSLPGVHRATMTLEEVDHSNKIALRGAQTRAAREIRATRLEGWRMLPLLAD